MFLVYADNVIFYRQLFTTLSSSLKISGMANNKSITGPVLILISTVFYASHGVWSKWLLPYFSVLDSSWARSLIVMALLLPFLLWRRQLIRPHRPEIRWLLAILVPGSLVTPLYFYAFAHLQVGVATLLFFMSYVLGAMVYGAVFFHERLTFIKVIASSLGVSGLILVALPDIGATSTLTAVLASIFAGICGAAEITFTKKLPEKYSPYYVTFLIFSLTLVLTGLLALLAPSSILLPNTTLPWLLILGYAISIIAGIVCVIRGFKTTEPSFGGIIGLMEVVIGIAFGILIFGEQLTVAASVGAIMILIAAFLPFFRYNGGK